MRWIPFPALPSLETRLTELVAHGRRTQQRDALAVLLALHGLRVKEVCQARVDDFDPGNSLLFVRTLKKGKPRTVRLHPTLITAILKWRGNASHCPLLFTRRGRPIFPSHLQRFARKITADVLGTPFRFHACRHTFAMRAYAATKDLLLVKKLLGHRWITSTQVYAEALDEMPDELLVSIGPSPTQEAALNSSSSNEDHACREPSTDQHESGQLRIFAKGA
jgi:integrase